MTSCRELLIRGTFVRMLCCGACTVGLFGCHDPRPAEALPADGANVPILRQYVGGDSREFRRMRVAVRDVEVWNALPLVDAPVDFERESALVVTLGRMLSDRYSVRITRVWREGRMLRVAVDVQEPPADAPLATTAPFCVAVIPRIDLPVEGFSFEPSGAQSHGRTSRVGRRDKIPHPPSSVRE